MSIQEKKSIKGTPYAIVKFSDKEGEFELFLFAEILVKNRDLIKESESFVLTLQKDKISDKNSNRRLNVKKINNRYDFVISSSVSSYDTILKNCESIFLSDNQNEFENGFILFKGGDLRNEFKNVSNFYTHEIFKKINLDFFNEKKLVHIPNPYNHT